ncbi:sulfate adenylyltransferase subunit 1 [Helicobacter sp. MIT 14-3879]|uniref:sulfate adenylyltransferase subunit 1 n=1 Tax=Helicobacter sp. MIT 14-3879 TaxID=2040649 RepID=UPI000E1F8942|nr:GTP-binding protein [Helicobacter sp. MIT 14-3879]RDU65501.1 GTPase [Helicobacter sp. MIT 14-3879]
MQHFDRMNIVITGHVDHGKSTLVGRLLADTNSLPQGKLDNIKLSCEKNARLFEYSMLLDALEDEQKQGITIDSARIFFKSNIREYVIIDAPGHIEFLRNMLSGASRAAAAILVIDAKDGIAENSKRHGIILSLLGISQIIVVINKLDIFDYNKEIFKDLKNKYLDFLSTLDLSPLSVVPVSARNGENIVTKSSKIPWYEGRSLLEELDSLHNEKELSSKNFMMPLQDIYRFSNNNDDRRIYAGSVASGKAKLGDKVLFLPSFKSATISNFEVWNSPNKNIIQANEAVGISLNEDIYVQNGEVIVLENEYYKNKILKPASLILVNLIWLGNNPLIKGKEYLFKLGSAKVKTSLESIKRAFSIKEEEIKEKEEAFYKNEVGSVILRLKNKVALCTFKDNQTLGRFVIVDGYDAVAGGIILNIIEEDEQNTFKENVNKDFEYELFSLLRKYFPHQF